MNGALYNSDFLLPEYDVNGNAIPGTGAFTVVPTRLNASSQNANLVGFFHRLPYWQKCAMRVTQLENAVKRRIAGLSHSREL